MRGHIRGYAACFYLAHLKNWKLILKTWKPILMELRVNLVTYVQYMSLITVTHSAVSKKQRKQFV